MLEKQGLQKPAAFVHKILQLHETLGVRFGAMLVGQAGTGKSTLLRTLQVRLLPCCCLAAALHPHISLVKASADRLTLWAIKSRSGNLFVVRFRTAL